MRNRSLVHHAHINPLSDHHNIMEKTMRKSRSPAKSSLKVQTSLGKHKSDSKEHPELLTPTSITMKNAFIIKNADQSFDHYFNLMKKRRGIAASPTKTVGKKQGLNGSLNHTYGAHALLNMSVGTSNQQPKVKILVEKQPAGRDGHSSFLYGEKWIVFGGDRHHMPYNDTYVLDLKKLFT